MFLTQIELIDFQSHKHTIIDIASQITAIVGPSDSGKSAIIRAIDWVRTNRPRGTGIIRQGTSEAIVVVSTNQGQIKRSKGKNKNQYVLKYKNADGTQTEEEFNVVGSNVPDNISLIAPLTDVNMQRQFDGHFLVMDSPGAIASTLNESCGLDKGVSALDRLNSKQSRLKNRAANTNTRLEDSRASLGDAYYLVLDAADEMITRLTGVEKQIETTTTKIELLRSLREKRVNTVAMHIRVSDALVGIHSKLGAIFGIFSEYEVLKEELQAIKCIKQIAVLRELLESVYEKQAGLVEHQDAITRIRNKIKSYKCKRSIFVCKGLLDKVVGVLASVADIEHVWAGCKAKCKVLVTLAKSKEDTTALRILKQTAIASYRTDLETFYIKNPICPACGGNFK